MSQPTSSHPKRPAGGAAKRQPAPNASRTLRARAASSCVVTRSVIRKDLANDQSRLKRRGARSRLRGLLPNVPCAASANLDALNQFAEGARVDVEMLRKAGLANGRAAGVKILGDGELTKKLTVSAHAFSASAKSKIESKGGTCELIAAKTVEPAKAQPPQKSGA